jgi:aspartate kinase
VVSNLAQFFFSLEYFCVLVVLIRFFVIALQVTAITYKKGVTVLDISSTQMLGAYGFLARVFASFEKHKLSVDVLASSEVSVSLTLDRRQEAESIDNLIDDLDDCSKVVRKNNYAILTLIADIDKSSQVLATAFSVFSNLDIQVEMMSQGASKVNISFIVKTEDLERAMHELHSRFFEPIEEVADAVAEIDIDIDMAKHNETVVVGPQ